MAMIFLAFCSVFGQVYSADIFWDNSAEGFFLMPSPDLLDDSALTFSPSPSESTSGILSPSNALDAEGFFDASAFLAEDSPQQDSIFTLDSFSTDVNGEEAGAVLIDYNPTMDPSTDIFDSPFATTDYELEADSSILDLDSSRIGCNRDDSSTAPEDYLAGYDSVGGSWTEFPPASLPTEDSNLVANIFFDEETTELAKSRPAKPKLNPGLIYDLDPRTHKYTLTTEAYARDGKTPIKPRICPQGKTKTCCWFDTIPQFSQCWSPEENNQVCQYAKNLFCCQRVPRGGAPGIDCENVQWVQARSRRSRATQPPPEQEQQSPSPSLESIENNQLEEIFPILRGLPDLDQNPNPDPNPGFCKTTIRRDRRR